MKKKLVAIILSVIMLFTMILSTGCTSTKGENGKSAYDLAVESGFKGTLDEWLESLKGAPGGSNSQNNNVTINSTGGDIKAAANKGLMSAVSIYTHFVHTTTTGGFWGIPSGTRDTDAYSAGSGVIYKLDKQKGNAYIITNYHVVYDAECNTKNKISDDIYVYVYGKEDEDHAIKATYVGGSMTYDIAVLYIENSDIIKNSSVAAVEVEDSNNIAVGQSAIAIGNPEAYGLSVTAGVVSIDSEYISMTATDNKTDVSLRVVRIDTAVNSGNSGGGLFDSNGKLIGIVNAKIKSSDVENIGYAIPSNVATAIADNILYYCDGKDCESVQRAIMGITIEIFDRDSHYNEEKGVFVKKEYSRVASITEGSIADGVFEIGDIVKSIKVGNVKRDVTRQFIVIDTMLLAREGDEVEFVVERNGQEKTLTVKITKDCLTQY